MKTLNPPRVINLTEQIVQWHPENPYILPELFMPSGQVARCTTITDVHEPIVYNQHMIPRVSVEYDEVVGLPPPTEGITYLVTADVLRAVRNRPDVISPDRSERAVVRNPSGEVIGVKRFLCAAGGA